MSILLPNEEEPSTLKVGSTTISRVYLGDTLVWGSAE